MIIKKSGGRWQLSLLASVVISAFFLNTAYAWQQEYIVDTQPGHSTERYTWDSDHQPSQLSTSQNHRVICLSGNSYSSFSNSEKCCGVIPTSS